MKLTYRARALGLLLAFAALAAPVARAQLITGKFWGKFEPLLPGDRGFGFTSITNTSVQSIFRTGQQFGGGGVTTLTFTDRLFSGKGDGDLLGANFLNLLNAPTRADTAADHAFVDIFMNIPAHGIHNWLLTTLDIGVDNTLNIGSGGIPDLFLISFAPLNSFTFGTTKVSFSLDFPPGFEVSPGAQIPERHSARTGELFVHFASAIPEPSTYAAWGALLLLSLAGYRRIRSRGLRPMAA
jgi:hypothetical protein